MRLLALSSVLMCSAVAALGDGDAPVINTACGPVIGGTKTNPDGSIVNVYRSIPYAQPPVGPLRWADPLPYCWKGTYNATAFKSVCAQGGGKTGSEDCLFVDVHVPQGLGNKPVPVLFYIHGGGLLGGSGQSQYVDVLASKLGIIIVTVQYRLNIFGWLCVEGMGHCNFGLRDQQLALQWTQTNIASFGGDPARVTVGGQSSGGTSIFALFASPGSSGLFAGAISMSGSPNISMGMPQAYAQNAPIVSGLGCAPPGSTPQQQLDCMRGLPATTLGAAVPASWDTPYLWGIDHLSTSGRDFAGLTIVDGTVITQSFQSALADGLIDVPFIIGSMGQESDIAPDNRIEGYTMPQWQALLNQSLAPWAASDPNFAAGVWMRYYADAVMTNGSSDVIVTAPQRAYDSLNADYGLQCANAEIAVGAKRGRFKSPIYLYVDQWTLGKPVPVSGGYNRTWAYHTWDYVCVIEDWNADAGQPSPTDLGQRDLLQTVWREFIFNGTVSSYGWRSVEQVDGFPAHYGSLVIGTPDLPPFQPTAFTVDYRADNCAYLAAHGFDSRFWWCN